ncbi:hypothetical protein B1748_15015 [Paenibacillus sp. MY03]|jgi:hypothetical protein|uniref:Uncharacterized protein n=1 Tax=Paenibacillus agaridevorans TaxID=171404 RepID=A0A2R5EHE1_9BACL|nr:MULTISPECIES: hypothetical protein [Paenibacillus]OUS75737.1 hypothetical protein B1748_15015 [Paenibacillus sp. MY03]QNK60358.1 hypothetical protein H7F31_16695 [Paenibacillus sp. PAMC21692]GBG05986.1 hypothetical protein PAT3040_00475 [Paenibacillus agaridevorans]
MRECLFYFKFIQDGQTKEYRTVAMVPDGKTPDISDFIHSFKQLGYTVELENERELIFHSLGGDKPYKLDITKIELKGQEHEDVAHDGELRAILNHLIKH